jgi:tetratricopeptide (TPR) repeat protein
MGETAAAAEVLQKAVALAPGDADIQTTYANALRLLGKYDEANEVYERVLASGTTSEFAQGWIGIFFSEIGEFKRATEVLQPTVDRYPKEAWLWSALGWAWQSLDFSSASLSADAYKKAMELEPERIWNWKGYADALFLLDPDKGRAEYEELLKALNASTNLEEEWRLYLLGWSNYRLRRYDDAVYLLQRAMHFDPNEYGPYFDVPLTLLAAGRRESAIREYTGALEKIKPLHARRQHGLLYIARFDLVEAVWHQCVAPDNAGPIIEKIDTALRESEFDTAKFAWMDEYVSPAWARPQLATPRPFAARDPAISRTAS